MHESPADLVGNRPELTPVPDDLRPYYDDVLARARAEVPPTAADLHVFGNATMLRRVVTDAVLPKYGNSIPGQMTEPSPVLKRVNPDAYAAARRAYDADRDADGEWGDAFRSECEHLYDAIARDGQRLWDLMLHDRALRLAAEAHKEHEKSARAQEARKRNETCPVCGQFDPDRNGHVLRRDVSPVTRRVGMAEPLRSCEVCWYLAREEWISRARAERQRPGVGGGAENLGDVGGEKPHKKLSWWQAALGEAPRHG